MPPRKKPTTDSNADVDPPRRSTRAKAPASTVSAGTTVPPAKPESQARPNSKAKPKSKVSTKTVSKRTRDDEYDEDAGKDHGTAEPASKKVKSEEKMIKVLKRGAAPVDPVSQYVATHQVLEMSGEVWDGMLNQTEIGKNANKFYVLQLLHPNGNNSSCILYTRWGRVGENGQSQTKGPFPATIAIGEFKKQFKSKTSTNWEQRHGMAAKKGKYTWLERSFEEDEEKDQVPEAGPSEKPKSVAAPDSKLPTEIQTVCNLIFNQSIVNAALSEMNYDANKLPLGKLSKNTILNGFSALKALSEVISQPNSDVVKRYSNFDRACEELTNSYYSIIPHIFGRNRPVVIINEQLLKKELDLVDALGDMQIAQSLIESSTPKDENGDPINPVDARFRSLELSSMEPVDPNSKEFAALLAYAADTQGSTHHYTINIQHAFRVQRDSEVEAWTKAGFQNLEDGQRLLLWHGSRSTNFAGILRQGLRIAPPEAPVTGYMFGKGVYFADMVSKSAGYCHTYLSNGLGLLLLCEVAAKPVFEQYQANYDAAAQCKAAGKMVTQGLGRFQPSEWQDAGVALDNPELNGCRMPKGVAQEIAGTQAGLLYNEYIAYDTSQIKLRYMLLFKN
ncbi:poly polymerase catalytic domain-containing protein [Vararia minispora EC-137]|uniref:Poly polymerase catalytic domain-containing protein n=1 Tax=Vararia minispora EC-137 TaxID=1314806 RepID=A0ACB8QUA6_9AGAM|nr:poly polymerase catalytic domain-containing protein [Vararia minispora EC-137]